MILGICSEPEVLEVLNLIKIVVSAICIMVPIILIISLMIAYTKSISDAEEQSKINRSLVTRAIAAIIIFFIPTFIRIILYIADFAGADVYDCFDKANAVDIDIAYTNKADKLVDIAKESLSRSDYVNAQIAVSKIDDKDSKNELSEELEKVEKYVVLMEEIESIKNSSESEQISDLEDKIDNVDNEEYKESLKDKFDETIKENTVLISEYPIVPFGEHDLYKNLKYFSNDQFSNLLNRNGSSVEEINKKIYEASKRHGFGTRKATVAAAVTLIGSVAETGYRLPYYFGGKRYKIGVDGTWGVFKDNPWCNDYYYDTQEGIDDCKKTKSYWGMDCEGFVNWAVIQGTQKEVDQLQTNWGTRENLGSKTADHAVCKIGDALRSNGHIALVVGLDDVNKRYIIAEESYGMELDKVSYSGNNGHFWCEHLDKNYID